MANWTLQHVAEIINGLAYKVKAQHLVDNFNGLKSDIDDRLSKTTASAQSFVGAVTWAAQQIFSNGLKADTISENTANAGVTVDGVLCKDSMVTVSGTPAANGQIGYASNVLNAYVNGSLKTIATTDAISLTPRYKAGPHCVYASAATVTLKSGYTILNSTGTTYLTFTADQTITLASSGAANALDTGAEASNTWYYVYAISDGTNVRGLFSTVNEAVTGSITLPSGYTLKAQTPYVWRNDGSSNIISGRYVGANNAPTFWYNVAFRGEGQTGTAGTTEILTNGSATTFTAVSAASFIPPASQFGWFYNSTAGSQNGVGIRATGESHNGIEMSGTNSGAGPVTPCATNSSQSIDYRRVDTGAANAWIAVAGFEVTEIA